MIDWMNQRAHRAWWCCVVVCLIASACGKAEYGEKGVVVRGRIVQNGEPLPLDRPDVGLGVVELKLIPQGANDPMDFASARGDGKFEFIGEGQGVKPGTYRLAVLHYKSGPGTDELQGKLDETNTQITLTVPADQMGDAYDAGDVELSEHLQ